MKAEEISTFLQARIEANDFPSAVYLVAEKGEIVFTDALGFAVVEPEKIKATTETIYDLASLTKPLVTGLLCAKLLEKNNIHLQDKLTKFFPEFDSTEKREITIKNLLTHTSGFPAWRPFYLNAESKVQRAESVFSQIVSQSLQTRPNEKVRYSDFNFLTLSFLLEKIYGKTLDEIAHEEIFEPLNLTKTFFNPPKNLKEKIAASEFGNFYEKRVCEEMFPKINIPQSTFRDYQIWGEVHDGNAWFLGGVAGHAGLFSNVEETFKIAQQFLPNTTELLNPFICFSFARNYTWDLNEVRSISFELAATKNSTASNALLENSFGHLGFTGTSIWIQPIDKYTSERIFILLTNRTHARELPFANINSVRRKFHQLATKVLNKK